MRIRFVEAAAARHRLERWVGESYEVTAPPLVGQNISVPIAGKVIGVSKLDPAVDGVEYLVVIVPKPNPLKKLLSKLPLRKLYKWPLGVGLWVGLIAALIFDWRYAKNLGWIDHTRIIPVAISGNWKVGESIGIA